MAPLIHRDGDHPSRGVRQPNYSSFYSSLLFSVALLALLARPVTSWQLHHRLHAHSSRSGLASQRSSTRHSSILTPPSITRGPMSLQASRAEVIDDPVPALPLWRQIGDAQVAFPPEFATPIGVVHFIGGSIVGTVPKAAYGPFIERLAKEGMCVVATPISFSVLDHDSGAAEALTIFEEAYGELQDIYGPRLLSSIPIFGMGHSLGAKMQVLLGCYGGLLDSDIGRPRANVLISFNNFSARKSVPLLTELKNLADKVISVKDTVKNINIVEQMGDLSRVIKAIDVLADGRINSVAKQGLDIAMNFVMGAASAVPTECKPDPATTWEMAKSTYKVKNNLIVQFTDDTLDESTQLAGCLSTRFPGADTSRFSRIRGTHITPNTPDDSVLRDLESGRTSAYPGARGGLDEIAATWFRESGVSDVSRAAAAKARLELDGLVTTVVDYLKEMASRPEEPFGVLDRGGGK